MHSCGNCRLSQCRTSFASTDYQCSDSEDTLDCQVDSVVLQCNSVRKNQDNLGILQKDHSQHVMYRTLLSYYSHNGPSEKRTENYDRLEILFSYRITNLREAAKRTPLSSGQWTSITPCTARSTYIFASKKQTVKPHPHQRAVFARPSTSNLRISHQRESAT